MTGKAQKFWSATRARAWAWSRPAIDRLVYTHGGVGDELMLTAIARAARRSGAPLHVLTEQPEIWRGNSDPASLQTGVERWFYAQRRGWIRTRIDHLAYDHLQPTHIARQMARRAGVTLPDDWRPHFPSAPAPAARDPNLVVLHTSCRGARFAAETKDWPESRWQSLAARLQPDFTLVQLGTPADPILPRATDLRGKTSVAQAAEWIARAGVFVGLESGLMHLAASVQTPAVILYGGRTRPEQTGYAHHVHLARTTPCTPCGLDRGCPHHLACLDVPVETVELAVRRLVAPPSS